MLIPGLNALQLFGGAPAAGGGGYDPMAILHQERIVTAGVTPLTDAQKEWLHLYYFSALREDATGDILSTGITEHVHRGLTEAQSRIDLLAENKTVTPVGTPTHTTAG